MTNDTFQASIFDAGTISIPPPLPTRSPRRAESQRSQTPSNPFSDRAEIVEAPLQDTQLSPVRDQSDPWLDRGGNNHEQANDNINTNLDQSYTRRSSQRAETSDPYTYVEGLNHDPSPPKQQKSNRKHSIAASGSELYRSHVSSSTIDPTFVHPFSQRIGLKAQGENWELGSSYDVKNPFADPVCTRPALGDPEDRYQTNATVSRAMHHDILGTPFRTQNSASRYPSDIKESPPLPNHIDKNKSRLPSRFKRKGDSQRKLSQEQKLLKTAIRQNYLLEQERRKTLARLYPEAPRPYASPRLSPTKGALRGLVERDVSSSSFAGLVQRDRRDDSFGSSSTGPSNSHRPRLRTPTFWVFVGLMVVGIILTGVAFGVTLRNNHTRARAEFSAGMVVWLICAIGTIILSITGLCCIWGMRQPRFIEVMSKAGLEELGLMPSFVQLRVRTVFEREEDDRRMRIRKQRIEERGRMNLRTDTMTSVRTLNPEWQALYSSPEDLRQESNSFLSTRGENMELQTLGSDVRGAESMSVETAARDFDEAIRDQMPTPTRPPFKRGLEKHKPQCPTSIAKLKVRAYTTTSQYLMPNTTLEESTNTAPTPASTSTTCYRTGRSTSPSFTKSTGREDLEIDDSTTANLKTQRKELMRRTAQIKSSTSVPPQSLQRGISKTLSQDFRLSPVISDSQLPVASESIPSPMSVAQPQADGSISTANIQPVSTPAHALTVNTNTSSRQLQSPVSVSNSRTSSSSTPLHNFSPLEALARDLNTPELRSLSTEDRAHYFVSQRSVCEEREKKVRANLSLVRTNTVDSRRDSQGKTTNGRSDERVGVDTADRKHLRDLEMPSKIVNKPVNADWKREDSYIGEIEDVDNIADRNHKSNQIRKTSIADNEPDQNTEKGHDDTQDVSMYSVASNPPQSDPLQPTQMLRTDAIQLRSEPSQTTLATQRSQSILQPATPSIANLFLTRKLKGPMIMERVRTLEQQRDENIRSGSTSRNASQRSLITDTKQDSGVGGSVEAKW